jgi:hypothetical protein
VSLYHFTCGHSARKIGRSGVLLPYGTLPGCPPLVWLTDLREPDRDALGLTSHTLTCDRTERRYVVRGDCDAIPWLSWVASPRHDEVRGLLERDGARPEHWWVTPSRVWVRRA